MIQKLENLHNCELRSTSTKAIFNNNRLTEHPYCERELLLSQITDYPGFKFFLILGFHATIRLFLLHTLYYNV